MPHNISLRTFRVEEAPLIVHPDTRDPTALRVAILSGPRQPAPGARVRRRMELDERALTVRLQVDEIVHLAQVFLSLVDTPVSSQHCHR